jgi:hypothetical protein
MFLEHQTIVGVRGRGEQEEIRKRRTGKRRTIGVTDQQEEDECDGSDVCDEILLKVV